MAESLNQTFACYHGSAELACLDPAERDRCLSHPNGGEITTEVDRLIDDLTSGVVRVRIWSGSIRCADNRAVQAEYRVSEFHQDTTVRTQVFCIEEVMHRLTGERITSSFNWPLAHLVESLTGTGGSPYSKKPAWVGTLPELFALVRIVKPATMLCDCGHECERSVALYASLGTSCPDCYDRMSDGE